MADQYGVPDALFGPIDEALPALIGRIVMVSAMIEYQVAAMAGSVQDLESNRYFAQDPARNFGVCKRLFRYFTSPAHLHQLSVGKEYLSRAKALLAERNEIVHRVWSVTAGDTWGGHKGQRGPGSKNTIDDGWRYNSARLEQLLTTMTDLCEFGARTALPSILALPRLPTPWADGIWPTRANPSKADPAV